MPHDTPSLTSPGRTSRSGAALVTQAELAEFVSLMPALAPLIKPRLRPPRRSVSRRDVAGLLRRAENLERWEQLRRELARRLVDGAEVEPGPISASARRVDVAGHIPVARLLAEGRVTAAEARLLERNNVPAYYLYLHIDCADGRRFCTAAEVGADSV